MLLAFSCKREMSNDARADYSAGEQIPVVVDGVMIGTVNVVDILP